MSKYSDTISQRSLSRFICLFIGASLSSWMTTTFFGDTADNAIRALVAIAVTSAYYELVILKGKSA